jgi:hypothetical protein
VSGREWEYITDLPVVTCRFHCVEIVAPPQGVKGFCDGQVTEVSCHSIYIQKWGVYLYTLLKTANQNFQKPHEHRHDVFL